MQPMNWWKRNQDEIMIWTFWGVFFVIISYTIYIGWFAVNDSFGETLIKASVACLAASVVSVVSTVVCYLVIQRL